ncbi:MAG: GGDEF domain-containing protein [Candidatus Nitrotoga sp.]
MEILTIKQVAIRIAIITLMVELLFMLTLEHSPLLRSMDGNLMALFNAVILVAITTPLIYFLVIKPFIIAHDAALTKISQLAYIDPLTQLANRRFLSKHLEMTVSGVVRHEIYGALLLLDLDGFKSINDAYGHDAGDAVLIAIAERLQSITRSEDVVGRLGGDEFVVLIDHLDNDEQIAHDKVSRITAKLLNKVNNPVEFNGKTLHVGASVGIRLLSFERVEAETAVHDADIAMYRAKQAGGGCAVFFEK